MSERSVLVTGAGSGLGHATARALVGRGAGRVFVTTTSADTAATVAERLAAGSTVRVEGLALDLGSRESITAFVRALHERLGSGGTLDALGFNAGIQIVNGFRKNDDDHELTMAVNQLGHVRLLFQLWDRIAHGGRVVFVGSNTHNPADWLSRAFGFRGATFHSVGDWLEGRGDPRRNPAHQGLDRYANAKLANIMTTFELARRVPALRMEFYALDPGLMPGTGLARTRSRVEQVGWRALRALIPVIPGSSSPEGSARIMADLMLGERNATTIEGRYVDFKGRPAPVSAVAADPQAARAMLDQTLEVLGLQAGVLAR